MLVSLRYAIGSSLVIISAINRSLNVPFFPSACKKLRIGDWMIY
jgi:hypothetical protein